MAKYPGLLLTEGDKHQALYQGLLNVGASLGGYSDKPISLAQQLGQAGRGFAQGYQGHISRTKQDQLEQMQAQSQQAQMEAQRMKIEEAKRQKAEREQRERVAREHFGGFVGPHTSERQAMIAADPWALMQSDVEAKKAAGASALEHQRALDLERLKQEGKDKPLDVQAYNEWRKQPENAGRSMLDFKKDMAAASKAPDSSKLINEDGTLTARGALSGEDDMRKELKPVREALSEDNRKMTNLSSALKLRTGQGDIAAINFLQKMVDEGVVRGEDIRVQQMAQSFVDQMKGWINQAKEGELLPDAVRQKMAQTAYSVYQNNTATHKRTVEGFRAISERRGMDFENIWPTELSSYFGVKEPKLSKGVRGKKIPPQELPNDLVPVN